MNSVDVDMGDQNKDSMLIGSQSIVGPNQYIDLVHNTNPSMSLDDSAEDVDHDKRVKQ
jgi:hypothetical protein